MIGIEQRAICDGVNFRSIRDTKFKTMRISAHLIVPMSRQTAAENALLPFLLSRASREYPDFTKLGQRLAELYGASLNADVQKLGDLQVLSLSASGIADRYALEGVSISGELAKLLCSLVSRRRLKARYGAGELSQRLLIKSRFLMGDRLFLRFLRWYYMGI